MYVRMDGFGLLLVNAKTTNRFRFKKIRTIPNLSGYHLHYFSTINHAREAVTAR